MVVHYAVKKVEEKLLLIIVRLIYIAYFCFIAISSPRPNLNSLVLLHKRSPEYCPVVSQEFLF